MRRYAYALVVLGILVMTAIMGGTIMIARDAFDVAFVRPSCVRACLARSAYANRLRDAHALESAEPSALHRPIMVRDSR